MSTTHSSSLDPRRSRDDGPAVSRALVLGGGGAAGNAWLIGVLAGLAEGGVDASAAELVIGTSAGATAAAQLAGATAAELLAAILDAEAPPAPGTASPGRVGSGTVGAVGSGAGRHPIGPLSGHLETTNRIIAASADLADMRRRMGAAALAVDEASDGSWSEQWRATALSRFPVRDWPAHRMLLTAVDARTGEPVEFGRHSGVELVDAVAASTSGGPSAYRIGDGRYIDGGYRRSSENADLAVGSERVLVLSPLGGRTRLPLGWGAELAVQVAELRAAGSTVEAILPDADSLAAFGDSMTNLATRVPAARAGHAQGRAAAAGLREFWG
ncbi:patatin-like phospholipase family protein [Herbiconiux sp. 11R-BC]|uniref:patatin-like phospholipase family protein n=1 Tax=Herbiconiux sp. 11R-BC TaxID=3111637 RepID=UPI003C09AB4B